MAPELKLSVGRSLVLSDKYQQRLSREWDKINSNPRSFVPREEKGRISLKRIRLENSQLGSFASEQLNQIFQETTETDRERRFASEKKIVAVGFGQGYDSDWLVAANSAGLQTCWIDISKVACDIATKKMSRIWAKIKPTYGLPPLVKRGEIRSILFRPDDIDLDLNSVEVWYMCRTLCALSRLSAQLVLRIMGQSLSDDMDPEKNRRILLINPLREHNPGRITRTSITISKKMMLTNLVRGAGRPLEVKEASHRYFDREYTAMTIKAK